MANLPPPSGVCRVSFSGTYEASHWANVFHVYCPTMDPTSLTQCVDLLTAIENVFVTDLFYALCASDFAATYAQLDASDGAGITSVNDVPTGMAGSADGSHAPGGTAMVVSWLGGWHYRGGKPRTYVGGLISEYIVEPTQFDGGPVGDMQSAANDVITSIAALSGTYGAVVIMGALLGNSPTSAGTFAPYTGALVRNQIGSQRRRNKGH